MVRGKHLWVVYLSNDYATTFSVIKCRNKDHVNAVLAFNSDVDALYGYHLVKVAPTFWLLREQRHPSLKHWMRHCAATPATVDDFLRREWKELVEKAGEEW